MHFMVIVVFITLCQPVSLWEVKHVEHDGIVCDLCPPGSFLINHCTSTTPTECAPCPSGTYADTWHHASYCRQCSFYCSRLFEYTIGKCNRTSNTICQCEEGFMLRNAEDPYCYPHSSCRPGYGVADRGTPLSDVQCEPCANGTYSDNWSPTAACKKLTNCTVFGLIVRKIGNKTRDNICWDGKNDVVSPTLPITLTLVVTTTVLEHSVKPSETNRLAFIIPLASVVVVSLIIACMCCAKRRSKQSGHRKILITEAHSQNDEDERSHFLNYEEEAQNDVKCSSPLLSHPETNFTFPRMNPKHLLNYLHSRPEDVTLIKDDNAMTIDFRKRRNSEVIPMLSYHSTKVGRFAVSSVFIPENGEINGLEKRNYLRNIGFDSLMRSNQNDTQMVKNVCLTIETKPLKYPFLLPPCDIDEGYYSLPLDRKIAFKEVVTMLSDTPKDYPRNFIAPRLLPPSPAIEEVPADKSVTARQTDTALPMSSYCPEDFQKNIPEKNINFFTEKNGINVHNYEEIWADGRNLTRHAPGEYYLYDSCGGDFQMSKCSMLTIPPLAIACGKYGITGRPVKNIEHFGNLLNIKEGEHIVAPVVEYQVAQNKGFSRPVKIKLQHCVFDQSALDNIKVYYAASQSSKMLTEVPRQSKDNNVVQEMCCVVEPDFIYIYTMHFTVYVVTCRGDRPMIMEAMLFAMYTGSPQEELRFHAYICDRLNLLDCIKENLIEHERKQGFKFVDCKGLNLIEEVEDGTRVKSMFSFGPDWQLGKDHLNEEIFPLEQEILVKSISTPLANRPTSTAEWVLHPNGQPEHFTGSIKIEMRTKEKKKKQRKKCNDVELDIVRTTKFWVNIALQDYLKRTTRNPEQTLSKCLESNDVSDEDWTKLCQHLAREIRKVNMKPLAYKLKLSDADLDDIDHRNPCDLQQTKYEICMLWRKRNPHEPPQTLLQAVEEVGEKLSAKEASESILEQTTSL